MRSWRERLFVTICFGATAIPLAALAFLFGAVVVKGAARLSWSLIVGWPSRHASEAGLLPALVGSVELLVLTALLAVPVGVGAALYFEEYGRSADGRPSRAARFLDLNVKNLAGVPSVVYGVLGLGLFVHTLGLGHSLIAGALTLALLVLPLVIVASREAIRAVPHAMREAGLALGATRWQVIRRVVLPMSLPGIATATILAMSRALGETAPLVVVGALTYVTFLPDGLNAPFTALPIQIWSWVSRPQPEFVENGAAGVVVLLVVLVLANLTGILVRDRAQRRGGER